MNQSVKALQPKTLWENFVALNSTPRPSKREEKVIAFMKNFGEKLQLPTSVDKVGNVLIKKAATKGMEDRSTVVLQAHLDMVCQKNNDTQFNFDTQGIEMLVEGDWVKANGTTLGADNGIGVAAIMTILQSTQIPHPPIEALFTIDEEAGMTGVKELQSNWLQGEILLNLDTEEDTELTIGCAGGVEVTASGTYKEVPLEQSSIGIELNLKGLSGGHSGMDIHRGKANANKLLNRILWNAQKFNLRLAFFRGGGLRNAIPREARALVAVPEKNGEQFESYIETITAACKKEFKLTDPNLEINVKRVKAPTHVLDQEMQTKLLSSIYASPYGIYRMSPSIEGLVQSSNNLAKIMIKEGTYTIQYLARSAMESEKNDLVESIKASLIHLDGAIELTGDYPGWEPLPNSTIVRLMTQLYQEVFDSTPKVTACHAGLECGLLGSKYPNMEMISFGPNIRGAHAPEEKVQISSVQKFWEFLLATLKHIK